MEAGGGRQGEGGSGSNSYRCSTFFLVVGHLTHSGNVL